MIGAFGGASRSLYEVIGGMPPGEVEPHFVTAAGTAEDYFSRRGPVVAARGMSQFDHTRYGHYRGRRWLVLLREVANTPATLLALRRARKRWGAFDLVHVNEITGILPWLVARRWFGAPAIVHVRSLVCDDPRLRRTRWLHRLLRTRAAGIVAIDESVRDTLPADLPVTVIHNGFSPGKRHGTDARLRAVLARLRPESFKIGFVGNLLRLKGVGELIEAVRLVRDRGIDIECIIVGGDTRPSRGPVAWALRLTGLVQDMGDEIRATIAKHGLADRIHMTGFSDDIDAAYQAMNVLCYPSHFDSPSRPIFEAAFFRVPSIAAISEPKPDTLIDGKTGLAIRPRDADGLAAAIEVLARDPARAAAMGEAAYEMAVRNFNPATNARLLVDLYKSVLASR